MSGRRKLTLDQGLELLRQLDDVTRGSLLDAVAAAATPQAVSSPVAASPPPSDPAPTTPAVKTLLEQLRGLDPQRLRDRARAAGLLGAAPATPANDSAFRAARTPTLSGDEIGPKRAARPMGSSSGVLRSRRDGQGR